MIGSYINHRFRRRDIFKLLPVSTGNGNSKIKQSINVSLSLFYLIAILILTAAVSLSSLLTPGSAYADGSNPRIEITPIEGPVGTIVYIRIFDYVPNNVVFVKYGTKVVTTITVETDVNGFAVASFTMDLAPAGQFPIYVDDGVNTHHGNFIVKPSVSIEPVGGSVGDIVTVKGNAFSASKPISIYFDDAKICTSDTNELGSFTNARFSIPASPLGKHVIKVQDSEGYTVSHDFNITQRMNINPSSVQVGETINISGVGFPAITNLVVYFDDKDMTAVQSDTHGVFNTTITAPACGDGLHKIKVSDGVNPAFGDITINPKIQISDTSGYIGMQVTISGTGFRVGNNINATYDDERLSGTTVDNNGNFSFNFKVPKSVSGNHTITVTDGVNTKNLSFDVESTPPLAPNLELPVDGTRFTKEIRFQWEAVMDPSGVLYMIEIADDARFTKPIVTQNNLVQTYFDLADDQKIMQGRSEPYFWRVRAIDGASNIGNWSVVGTFYKGYTVGSIMTDMPGWTKFVLIALGLVLFIFLILFIWRSVRRVSEAEYSEEEEYMDGDYSGDWEEMPKPNKSLK